MSTSLVTAVWVATWKCSLQCPYCINYLSGITRQQSGGLAAPIDCDAWTDMWCRYDPESIIITGGEPLLIPNLVSFLNRMPNQMFELNTNLTCNIDRLFACVKRSVPLNITATYHPTQQPQEEFFANMDKLVMAGFKVCASFVMHPIQFKQFRDMARGCHQRNIKLFPQPAVDCNKRVVHTPKQVAYAKHCCHARKHHLIDREVPSETTRQCTAGHGYMCVMPNGDAFRCAATAAFDNPHGPLGNVFDNPNVLLKDTLTECNYGKCCGCDEDNAYIMPAASEWYARFQERRLAEEIRKKHE